jgi:hypothetical protein
MRVPFTFNSKKLLRGCSKEDSIVTIRHRWNGYRPSVKQLLADLLHMAEVKGVGTGKD